MQPGHSTGSESEGRRRFFPRWAKHASPRCPKHPSRAMRKEKQKLPVWATTGALKEGTRIVWHCKVAGCHMVSVGEHMPYFGESVRELGSLEGV
jgi:hypothetical protein